MFRVLILTTAARGTITEWPESLREVAARLEERGVLRVLAVTPLERTGPLERAA